MRTFIFSLFLLSPMLYCQEYIKAIPSAYQIPGFLQDQVDFNLEEGKIYLWKQLNLLTDFYKLPTENLAAVKEKKVYKASDLFLFCHATQTSLFQLEKCQAMAVAVLVANKIPVLLEMVYNASDRTHFYALFYKYAIRPNPSLLSGGQNGDKEQVYLEHNVANDINVTLHGSKDYVDNIQSALSSDLFDYDGKRRYDERLRMAVFTSGSITLFGIFSRHVIYNNLYVLAPRGTTAKSLEEMINAGLGDRDLSYKAPKIRKVF